MSVESVGHLQVSHWFANLSEGAVLNPIYFITGQIQPRHAGNVVKSVVSDNFDVGVDEIENLESRGEFLKLTQNQISIISGRGESNFPQRPHDPHLAERNVPHVVSLKIQILQSKPSQEVIEYSK